MQQCLQHKPMCLLMFLKHNKLNDSNKVPPQQPYPPHPLHPPDLWQILSWPISVESTSSEAQLPSLQLKSNTELPPSPPRRGPQTPIWKKPGDLYQTHAALGMSPLVSAGTGRLPSGLVLEREDGQQKWGVMDNRIGTRWGRLGFRGRFHEGWISF